MSRQILVTGVGAVTPLGVGARTALERWAAESRPLATADPDCAVGLSDALGFGGHNLVLCLEVR